MTVSKSGLLYTFGAVLLSTLGAYSYYQSTSDAEKNVPSMLFAKTTVDSIQTAEKPASQRSLNQKELQNKDILESNTERTVEKAKQPIQVQQSTQQQAMNDLLLAEKAEEIEDERLLESIDKEIAETRPQPMLWQELGNDEDLSYVKIDENIQGARKIKMDVELLKKVVPGDQLQLPMLGGNEYTVNVEKVKESKNNTHVRGHINIAGDSYLATMTQGEKLTFATVSTPNGTYDVQLVDGKGWVYNSDQLNAHIDTTKTDVLLPPSDLVDIKTTTKSNTEL